MNCSSTTSRSPFPFVRSFNTEYTRLRAPERQGARYSTLLLTDDGEVYFEVSGRGVAEVHSTSIHPFVRESYVIHQELSWSGRRPEVRSRTKCRRRRPQFGLTELTPSHIETV
jgi:hypothetical protein